MTLLDDLRDGKTPDLVKCVASSEKMGVAELCDRLLAGTAIIPNNVGRELRRPAGIGQGLRTKINANLGTSQRQPDLDLELEKLEIAVQAGADTVMDLSTGGDLDFARRELIARSPVALGTVPIYQAAAQALTAGGSFLDMEADDLFKVIEDHARDGVDFMTVHVGVTQQVVASLRRAGRVTEVVSRGGSLLMGWMLHRKEENPLYAQFDRLIELARAYDVTLSLGDGLRPGCLADATDAPQVNELIVLGELQQRAIQAGVQVMIEGPGHLPLDQIESNVKLEKSLCSGAPFYVLGPLVTDVAPGYDHIVAAIGGAVAGAAGADFLCYVTPSEHLGLPNVDDVRLGTIASRIAAHAADVAKGIPGAADWDLAMARARKALDWTAQASLAIDSAPAMRPDAGGDLGEACSMCGEYCALKISTESLAAERSLPSEHSRMAPVTGG